MMKVIILAAGKGERMRPLTLTTPKPLLEIQGKKVIDYVFDALPEDVDEAIVVVRYLGEKIKEYLGERYKGKKIRYAEGSEKGNAYSFLASKSLLQEGERFFIIQGDEPQRKIELKECLEKKYAWVCSYLPEVRPSGIATVDDSGRILEVLENPENPKSRWSAMGTMLVDTDIFKYKPALHKDGEYHLSSMLNQFVKDHPVYMVEGVPRPPLTSLSHLNWDMKDFL